MNDKKQKLIDKLEQMQADLRDMRDKQDAVKCIVDEECICNYFDLVLDQIDILKNEIKEG